MKVSVLWELAFHWAQGSGLTQGVYCLGYPCGRLCCRPAESKSLGMGPAYGCSEKVPPGDTHGHPWLRITDLKGEWSMVPCLDCNASGSPAEGVYFFYVFFCSINNSSVFNVRFFRTTAVCSKYLPSVPCLLGNGVLMGRAAADSLIKKEKYRLHVIFFFVFFPRGWCDYSQNPSIRRICHRGRCQVGER